MKKEAEKETKDLRKKPNYVFKLVKVKLVEGIAYYNGQFKTGIPKGLLTFPFSL